MPFQQRFKNFKVRPGDGIPGLRFSLAPECESVPSYPCIFVPSWIKQEGWTEFPWRCPFLLSHATILLFNGHRTIGGPGKESYIVMEECVSFPQGHQWKGSSPEPRRMISFIKNLRNSENQEVFSFFPVSVTSLPHRRIWFGSLFVSILESWEPDCCWLQVHIYACKHICW